MKLESERRHEDLAAAIAFFTEFGLVLEGQTPRGTLGGSRRGHSRRAGPEDPAVDGALTDRLTRPRQATKHR